MNLRRTVFAAVLAAVVLAGCGAAEKISPRVAVRDAAKSTTSQKEGTFTLSLVGSEADVNTLFNEGAKLSAEDRQGLNLVRNGHIAFSTAAGKFGLDVKAGDLEHAFELRVIDKKLYARADVAGIAKLIGASPDQISASIGGLASQEGFGFLADAMAGRWLTTDLTQLTGLFNKVGQQYLDANGATTPSSAADPKAMPSQFKALRDAIGKALTEDVTIKKLQSDSVGDHYLGTVASLRSFYAKVRPVFAQQLGKLPYANALPPDSAVPDRPASLDVWIKSGRVSRLEVDLPQFWPTPPKTGRVALRLDIDRQAPTLTAPPNAVNVDLVGILGKFINQFAGLGGGTTG